MFPMFIRPLTVTCILIGILGTSCVKKKLYVAEQMARKSAEGQITVLSKELYDRKKEATSLINQVGDLNRQIGTLQKETTDLQTELSKRTEMMGASSEKLLTEKKELEMKYLTTSKTLEAKEKELNAIHGLEARRDQSLREENAALSDKLQGLVGNGVNLLIADDHIEMTIEDRLLFDRDGVKLNPSAQVVLSGIANFLAERPAYKVQIHAHVDNQLPVRNKEITDTWAYAQVRALNIVRMLTTSLNVNAYMIAPVARGEFLPVSTNSTVEGRAENRRTIVFLYPKLETLSGN